VLLSNNFNKSARERKAKEKALFTRTFPYLRFFYFSSVSEILSGFKETNRTSRREGCGDKANPR
jgi:hypothetical protein